MAVTPGPPPFDPSQKQPVLQGAQGTDPYVGKPKPMPKPVPQRPAYGSSDGSGFDFAKWQAGQHRPRPTMILPGQGQGPMPVGTKPLPSPAVRDTRGGGWDPTSGDPRGGMMTGVWNPPAGMKTGSVGPGGPRMGGWNNQLTEGTPEYGDWVRRMKLQHGEDWTPDGNPMQTTVPGPSGPGMPTSYGGPNQARDFNMPNYGAPVQRGPMGAPGGPPPMGTGPGSMGKPQQSGGGGRQPLRPGMEYRPGGGQRPVGGGMQGAPQDGGQSQLPPQYAQAWNDLQGLGQQGGWDPRMGSGYYGAF